MNVSAALLRIAGLVFLALPLLYNELTLRLLYSGNKLEPAVTHSLRGTQLIFLTLGIALTGLGWLLPRISPLNVWTSRNLVASMLLLLLVLLVPIVVVELALQPFTLDRQKTTIFVQDPDLGWKLKPSHRGRWGDVEVSINSKGLRGPEIPYDRTPNRSRILYLGDSVTFGYKLAPYEVTFPSRLGARVESEFGIATDSINAGVGGYSPWQYLGFLETEGLRYSPDLIVLSFVLNDVTEKFRLLRFGGDWSGYQLAHQATSVFDRFAAKSALVFAIRQWTARGRFGPEIQQGAIQQETMNDWSLIQEPDSERVQEAWRITLENLDRIANLCEHHEIPLVILAFPSTYQFLDIAENGRPQRKVIDFAAERGVLAIDMLRALHDRAAIEQVSPFDYFLDENHLSELGTAAVAEIVAPKLAPLLKARPD